MKVTSRGSNSYFPAPKASVKGRGLPGLCTGRSSTHSTMSVILKEGMELWFDPELCMDRLDEDFIDEHLFKPCEILSIVPGGDTVTVGCGGESLAMLTRGSKAVQASSKDGVPDIMDLAEYNEES